MADNKNTNSVNHKRKKRVNHIKTMIVVTAVLLLITSFVLNIFLVFKVLELQNKMKQMYSDTSVTMTVNI